MPEDVKEPTIYDAVSEAVKEVTVAPSDDDAAAAAAASAASEEEEVHDDGKEGGAAGEGADADDDDESAGGEAGDGEGSADGEPGADKDAAGKGAKAGEGKDAGEHEEEDDPVNAPIPEGLKEATRERMQTLATKVKELAPVAQERDELLGAIEATGATPQQYAQTLQFLSLYNSDQAEHRKQALGVLKGMINELSVELNETVELDPLASYPDLQAEVEEKTLTPERAREIARGRERDRIAKARRDAADQAASSQQETAQAVETGKTALNTLEQQLHSRDKEVYLRKKIALLPVLKSALRQVHPSKWAATFLEAYNALPATNLPPLPTPPPNPTPGKTPAQQQQQQQQPMRARQPAGGATKAPANAVEAVQQALRGV